eukprot:gnl/TRDRNA2_/TRDRNA2_174096_c1_seq10.p1 gnl/TRDRNA2_/TRDRNA2_174096_c1~~gnl/TRDRNA2_/TRDRNA2_174096_c1_seq10.p1  ORF type:complete len:263 (-),score=54.88 gnl/TRDRNA2_/TRDRNA2_174096_c1_seq10:53-841(-)
MLQIVLCFAMLAAASADQLRSNHRAEGFVRSLEFKHRLRVCNAYPYNAALDVYRGKSEKLTSDGAMPYKSCKDFSTPLKAGDKLEFKVGDASAGTFSVSDLPNNDAVLMLVIHRHDTLSTAVSFESHVFANLQNAQIAVIDTYKGHAVATPRIMDKPLSKNITARSEELRFNSVVAVNQGIYEVTLVDPSGKKMSEQQLVALNRESYIVLRAGVEAQNGPAYPESIIVFPQSDVNALPKSGAAARAFLLAPLLAAAAMLFGC